MELRHLRYFVAVADELHLTRAAAKLGMAQPPLTQQIKALERELGVALFRRSGRGVVLTNAGAIFLGEAKAILERVAAAARKAKDAGLGVIGRLSVGFTESASFHPLVTQALQAFQLAYPDVELSLREAPSTDLISAIASDALDLAFVRPPYPTHPAVFSEPLADEAMVAALPITHPLAARKSLRLEALAGERFILYPRAIRPGLSDEIVEACRSCGFEPKVVQEAPQLSSTINLVATGMGVSIVPDGMRHVRARDVRYVPFQGLPVKAHLALAGRAKTPSPLTANFRQTLLGLVSRQPDQDGPVLVAG